MAYGSWSSYYTKTVWNSASYNGNYPYSIDVKYRYRQDIINNKTQIEGTSVTLRENISDWGISGSTFQASLGSSSSSYSGGSKVVPGYAPSSTTITLNKQWEVSHSSSGTATATIYWRGWSDDSADTYFQRSNSWSSFSITLPTIDTATPVISITSATLTSDTEVKVIAKATVGGTSTLCDAWWYKLDGGSWTQLSGSATSVATAYIPLSTQANHSIQMRGRRSTNSKTGDSSTVTINNVKPIITVTVDNIGVDSFRVNATSDVECNEWLLSTDNGSTYTKISSTKGTTLSYTTSAKANTTYKVIVKAKRVSNERYGLSSVKSVTTPSNSIITAITKYEADNTDASGIELTWVVYDASYTHVFSLIDSNDNVLNQWSDITKTSTGSSTLVLETDASLRMAMLNEVPNTQQSVSLTLRLTTYSGSTQIGDVATGNVVVSTSAGKSKPAINNLVIKDINATTLSLTNDNQVFIRGNSTALVSFDADANNGAYLSSIKINNTEILSGQSVSTYSVSKEYTAIENATYRIVITDSRGYASETTYEGATIAYSAPSITANISRTIPVNDNKAELEFSGSCYGLWFGDSGVKNTLTVTYTYSGNTKTIAATNYDVSNTSYYSKSSDGSAGAIELTDSFDYNTTYSVTVTVADKLNSASITLSLQKGLPIFDFGSDDFNFNVDVLFVNPAVFNNASTFKGASVFNDSVTLPDAVFTDVLDPSTSEQITMSTFAAAAFDYILTDDEYNELISD